MRKWTIAVIAAGGLLATTLPDTASAQRASRGANRSDDFDFDQDYQEGAAAPRRGNRAGGQPGQAQYGQAQSGQAQSGQAPSGQAQPGRGGAAGGQRYLSRRVSNDTANRQPSQVDRELASWLTVDNRGEIALAELAREQASDSDVREFAETMIDEHSKMVEQLQPFSDEHQANARGARRAPQRGGINETERQPQRRGQGQLNIVRLKQQLGQQCVASAKKELSQKDGDEFDKCYVGMQIAKHMEMLDTLKVFSHYASEDLDQLIEEAEGTTEEHLEHAKQLIKQLEQSGHGHATSHASAHSRSDSGTRSTRRSATGRGAATRSTERTSRDSDEDSDDDSDD